MNRCLGATIQFGQLFRRYKCVTAMLRMWISSHVGVGIDLLLLAGPCIAEPDARVPCSPLQFPRRPQRSGGHHTAAVPPLELAHCVANLREKQMLRYTALSRTTPSGPFFSEIEC